MEKQENQILNFIAEHQKLIASNQKRIEGNLDKFMERTTNNLEEINKHFITLNGSVAKIKTRQEICPIDDVVNQTEFVRFFSKYWKLTIFIIIIIGIVIATKGYEYIINLL